jgi:hypothetical protein
MRTDINIFENAGPMLKVNAAKPESQTVGDPLPTHSMDAGVAELNRIGRENAINQMTSAREQFYAESKPVADFSGFTPQGFSIEDDNLVALIVDGNIHTFSAGQDLALMQTASSPLSFEAKLGNLKNLIEHLGDSAANYTDIFDAALQGIVDEFIDRGGVFVQADKDGVAESIRAIFNGAEGKYTANDLKTMAVLAFETSVGGAYSSGDSEHALGTILGFDALKIEMARNAGMLSDAAYSTVKDVFNAHVDELIKQMNDYLSWANNDAFMPKDVNYSPARPEVVWKTIDFMLKALDGNDFNQSIRATLRGLEDMHNAQRESQIQSGSLDQRYNMRFLGSEFDRTLIGDSIQISSRFFADFLNRPEWAVSGSVFSVSVTV